MPRGGSVAYGHRLAGLLAVLTVLGSAATSRAGEAYYLLMFGSQQIPNNPDYSHTSATFVRATWPGAGPCLAPPRLEAHTISWLPRNLVVRTYALLPECGRNFDLDATLRYELANGERVSLWGPYQIQPELYQRALRQIALLESGQVLYKANDVGRKTDHVSNCIHAVSSIAEGYRLRVAVPGWGEMASYYVLRELEPWVVQPGRDHFWVASALGLDRYPIIYRDGQNPRSAAFRGAVSRWFGAERDLHPSYGPPR